MFVPQKKVGAKATLLVRHRLSPKVTVKKASKGERKRMRKKRSKIKRRRKQNEEAKTGDGEIDAKIFGGVFWTLCLQNTKLQFSSCLRNTKKGSRLSSILPWFALSEIHFDLKIRNMALRYNGYKKSDCLNIEEVPASYSLLKKQ